MRCGTTMGINVYVYVYGCVCVCGSLCGIILNIFEVVPESVDIPLSI